MQTSAHPETRSALSLWVEPASVAPPPSEVVAAVLAFGDLHEFREDGSTQIRFSPARLDQEDMRLILGEARGRALDVSVLWDEREEQVLAVIDLAPLRAREPAWRNKDRRRGGFASYDLGAMAAAEAA